MEGAVPDSEWNLSSLPLALSTSPVSTGWDKFLRRISAAEDGSHEVT